jgi:hypothetical protein
MKAAEFEAIRAELGLNKAGLAGQLGIDIRTARGYASGAQPVPRLVALACEALASRVRMARERETIAQAAALLRCVGG